MQKFKSKVDIIYEKLKEDIISGVYKPGERLVISFISKQNKISDIPVREAIRILESENLINSVPNVGPVVTELQIEDILESLMIRGILEGQAARLSIDYITKEKMLDLENILVKMNKAIQESDIKLYGELNILFHRSIYEKIPYPLLNKMIVDLRECQERTRTVFTLAPERIKESIGEHEKVLELIKGKKYDEIDAYMRNHRMATASRLKKFFYKNKGGN